MRQRVLLRLRCKPDKEEEYRERHKNVWSSVKTDLARAGVESMNIWMEGNDVFLMMEMEPGVSFREATELLDACPDSIRWEEYMEPIMLSSDGDGSYDPSNAYPDGLEEVFQWTRPARVLSQVWRRRLMLVAGGLVGGVLLGYAGRTIQSTAFSCRVLLA